MKKGQEVWLAKYALTGGIEKVTVGGNTNSQYVRLTERTWNLYKIGHDVFADHAEAVKAAEALRQKKLDSLRKQCMKLEKMKF